VKFQVKFDISSAAFMGNGNKDEVVRILRELADNVEVMHRDFLKMGDSWTIWEKIGSPGFIIGQAKVMR
jgi:hypothetical protein